jgi:hypothetical protein
MEPTRLEEAAPGVRAAVAPLPVANQRRELALLAISGVDRARRRDRRLDHRAGAERDRDRAGGAQHRHRRPKALRKAIVAARTLTLNINLLMFIAVVGAS